uniref:ATP synthase F0 subunit 8 n=1 Tax=Corthylus rubricollis TaxID=1220277 RepID=A0A3G2JZH6_9CUCU|nr:ATP synthase F0 subunit 8 [Corthylus rubricollis]
MPQMGPLQWTSLFIYFLILFTMIIMMNYYMFLYNPTYKKINKISIYLNWKW